MGITTTPNAADARTEVAGILQGFIPTLNDLYLQTRQAHWNVVGPHFLSVHEQLEEIYEDVAKLTDDIAERIRQFGVVVDGRLAAIQDGTRLPPFPDGAPKDEEAVRLIADRIGKTISHLREHVEHLDDLDPPSQDLINGTILALEKHHWMLISRLAR